MWDFVTMTEPVARKKHTCDDCRTPILPGEKYLRTEGKWDGYMMTYKSHSDCHACCVALADHLQLFADEGLRNPDDFEPEDWAWLSEVMPKESARLRAAYKRQPQ